MSTWAKVNSKNIVIDVVVGDNNDPNGDEGYQWLIDNLGGTWVKTSYNTHAGVHTLGGTPFRKNFAQPGYFWDEEKDAFYQPECSIPSWIFNETKCIWEPPIPKPSNMEFGEWDEEKQGWVKVTPPAELIP